MSEFYTQHIRLKTSPHAVKTYVVVSIRNNEYFSFSALRLLVGHESWASSEGPGRETLVNTLTLIWDLGLM